MYEGQKGKSADSAHKKEMVRHGSVGKKPEEYREIKPYWDVRIAKWLNIEPAKENIERITRMLRHGTLSWRPEMKAKFINGYGSSRPSFVADCDISIGIGRKEWGAEPGKENYVIHIKGLHNSSSNRKE